MQKYNAEIWKRQTRCVHSCSSALQLVLPGRIAIILIGIIVLSGSMVSAQSDVEIVGETNVISTTRKVSGAATGNEIQSARTGRDFHIVVVGLPSNEVLQLELVFAELENKPQGARTFNLTVNDKPALANFDISAEAEGPLRSVIKKFSITPDRGFLDFHFTGTKGDALVNSISITGSDVEKVITAPAPTIASRLSDPDEYAVPADQQASFEVESGRINVSGEVETWSSGMPIGGIGTGKFEILPNGQFANFTINNSWDLPVLRPRGTFLAFAAKASSSGGSARLLYVNPSDPSEKEHFSGHQTVAEASYKGEFPFSAVEFSDKTIPLKVTVEGWSPLIPHDVANSSLPAGVVNVTVENPEKYPISTAVAFSWEDLNGRGGSLLPGDQHGFSGRTSHRDAATSNIKGFQITSESFETDRPSTFMGNYFVGTPIKGATITRDLHWNPRTGTIPWWNRFSSRLRLNRIPDSPAEFKSDAKTGPMASTLCVSFNLAPGEIRRVPFIVSWYFPEIVTLDSTGANPSIEAPDYADRFGSSAGVASYLITNRSDLRTATEAWYEMINRATVPQWVKTHSLNSLFPMRSNSIMLKNSRFAMLEAPADMKGMLGPIDLRMAGSDFIRTMFPNLEKTELNLYARAQDDTGRIPRYVGNIHGALSGFDPALLGNDWVDPTSAWILQVAAYWRETGDGPFIKSLGDQITKARDYLRAQLQGGGADKSLNAFSATDGFATSGNMTVLNIVAALTAAQEMLQDKSETDTSLIRETVADFDMTATTSTFSAMASSDYALTQAGLSPLFDRDSLIGILKRIHETNFAQSKPVPVMEQNTGSASAGENFSFPAPLQAYVGAVALSYGMADIGLEPYLRMFQVAYAAQKAPWKQALRYDTPTGARASIRYHRSAMSAWSIWRSISGAVHDMENQRLYLNPQPLPGTDGDMEIPVFTPTFWGWLKFNDTDSTGTLAVTHVFGETSVTLLSIAQRHNVDGTPEKLVTFEEPLVLEVDSTLEFQGWPGEPNGTVSPQKPQLPEPEDDTTTGTISLDDALTTPTADDDGTTTSRLSEDGEEMPPTPEESEFSDEAATPDEEDVEEGSSADNESGSDEDGSVDE